MISKKFFTALKTSAVPNYRIAQECGVHPNWISKILHGAIRLKKDDPRIIRIAKQLGLEPSEAFEEGKTVP